MKKLSPEEAKKQLSEKTIDLKNFAIENNLELFFVAAFRENDDAVAVLVGSKRGLSEMLAGIINGNKDYKAVGIETLKVIAKGHLDKVFEKVQDFEEKNSTSSEEKEEAPTADKIKDIPVEEAETAQ